MNIKGLKIESGNNGKTIVEVWAQCHSMDDCDDIIAWLGLAKYVIEEWGNINAKAPRTAKAPASEDEAPQPGKIQSEPQVA